LGLGLFLPQLDVGFFQVPGPLRDQLVGGVAKAPQLDNHGADQSGRQHHANRKHHPVELLKGPLEGGDRPIHGEGSAQRGEMRRDL
jgi:hypothetical protein